MNGLHHVRPGQVQQVVVALEVLGVVLEPVAPVVRFPELPRLGHGPHGPVDHDDALLELLEEGSNAGAEGVHSRPPSLSLPIHRMQVRLRIF